jgi:hypothetical protein
MPSIFARAALLGSALTFVSLGAYAHEIVGNRFFPAQIVADDPGVNDELSVPTASLFKNGDDPSAKQLDLSFEYSKRITDAFALIVQPTWTHLYAPGGPLGTSASGFQNLETTAKYRFYRNAEHEFIMSVGLVAEWANTGAKSLNVDTFTTYTPTFYFGKGLGDLPDTIWWMRPFAVTGVVGYAIPSRSRTITQSIDPDSGDTIINSMPNPRFLNWGGSLQYSMPYLKTAVNDLGLPDFINHLIPIVEFSLQTPVSNLAGLDTKPLTTGTINPGVLWVANTYQVGVEAIIPVNHQSGTSVGVIAQLHLYLDDLFPTTIGKPLFGESTTPARPF